MKLVDVIDCWEEFCAVSDDNKEAYFALAMLLQYRDIVNKGWIPNYKSLECKFAIIMYENKICTNNITKGTSNLLTFQSEEIRDKFLVTHRELILKAKMFL